MSLGMQWSQLWAVPIARVELMPQQIADRDEYSPEAIASRRGLDVRLVPAAFMAWAVVALTINVRSWWIPSVCCVLGTASLVAWVYVGHQSITGKQAALRQRRLREVVLALAVAAGVGSAMSTACMMRIEVIEHHPLVKDGVASSHKSMVPVAGTPKSLDGGSVLVPVRIPGLGTVPMFFSPSHAFGASGAAMDVRPGQMIDVAFRVKDSQGSRAAMVPITLNATRSINQVQEQDGPWSLSRHTREALADASATMPGNSGDIVPGMVVGDITMQSQQLQDQFVATGLSHLSAVSGANCAIVMGAAMVLATALGAGRWTRLGAAAGSLAGFVLLVGPEPSILRAAVMGSIGVVAVATALWRDISASACWAVMGLLLWDPGLSTNYGFILSLVATVGIIVLAPWLSRLLLWRWWRFMESRWGKRPPAWQGMFIRLVMVSAAADLVTAPVIMHMAGRMSLVAVPANVLVSWAVPIVTIGGLILAGCGLLVGVPLIGWCAMVIIRLVGWAVAPAAWWIQAVAQTLSHFPHIEAPEGTVSFLVFVGLLAVVGFVIHQRRHAFAPLGAGIVMVLLALAVRYNQGAVSVVGDSTPEWRPPDSISVEGLRVVEVASEDQALRVGKQDADIIIDRTCGQPTDRPTLTPVGIPVLYPCRDGIELLGLKNVSPKDVE